MMILLKRIVLLPFVGTALWAGATKVTLKNGKVYTVETQEQLPLRVNTSQVKLIAVDPLIALSKEMTPTASEDVESSKITHLWFLNGKVKVPGGFIVTVTSPLDASIQATFKTDDSGSFTYEGFSKTRVPAAWSWMDESGDSWIPIQIHFQSEDSRTVFEVIQWVKQDENRKKMIKKFEEHLTSLK